MATLTIEIPDDVMGRLAAEASRSSRRVEDVATELLAAVPGVPRRVVPPRDQSDLAERIERVADLRESLRAKGVMIDPDELKRDLGDGRP